jgi:hypothetical protein
MLHLSAAANIKEHANASQVQLVEMYTRIIRTNNKTNFKKISNKQRPLLGNFRWIFVDFRELLMRRLPKLARKLPKGGRFFSMFNRKIMILY